MGSDFENGRNSDPVSPTSRQCEAFLLKSPRIRRGRAAAFFPLLETLLVGVSLAAMSASMAKAVDVYVSPTGNDQWSGALAAPKSDGNDGPVATIQRAQKLVRVLRTAQPSRKAP